ncbi:hypothetical protein ACFV98_16585 [Streptomyces violascens]|uniref:hypothetical protein n=1 Tax=Streptomyces violascens TaxID=67381 RepID=UPI0036602035
MSVPGGTLRVTSGRDLELVRRCSPPMTSMHRLVALLIVVAGVFVDWECSSDGYLPPLRLLVRLL